MKKVSSILWGMVLVAAGVILALNTFGITSINLFFDGWWTLIIIVPCVIGLFTDYDKGGNLIGICIGVILLLCCRDVLDFTMFWRLLIPAIIVIIGVRMILGSIFINRSGQTCKQIGSGDAVLRQGAATFSGASFDYTGEIFEGAQLDAVFGGTKCDLRGALIDHDCVINASAIFGGIDLYIPENLNVEVRSNSIFGGVGGKKRRKDPQNQYTLYLNATCLFGGVEIK